MIFIIFLCSFVRPIGRVKVCSFIHQHYANKWKLIFWKALNRKKNRKLIIKEQILCCAHIIHHTNSNIQVFYRYIVGMWEICVENNITTKRIAWALSHLFTRAQYLSNVIKAPLCDRYSFRILYYSIAIWFQVFDQSLQRDIFFRSWKFVLYSTQHTLFIYLEKLSRYIHIIGKHTTETHKHIHTMATCL